MSDLNGRWETLLQDLYAPPNELRIGQIAELDDWLAVSRAAFTAEPQLPVILPYRVSGATGYYALAADRDQLRLLGSYLTATVGTPWSTFDGSTVNERPNNQELNQELDQVVSRFVLGDGSLVFYFEVPVPARGAARVALRGLMNRMAQTPSRAFSIELPIRRLLGDFENACAMQWRRVAELSLQRLVSDHRVTARNRLFLEIEFLAAFDQWDALAEAIDSSDILRLQRPSLVSDALARFVMSQIATPEQPEAFAKIASRFGALVPSTAAVRSQHGADYYCLWASGCGEPVDVVIGRVEGAGWSAAVLRERPSSAFEGISTDTVSDPTGSVRLAIEQGRLDSAVEILGRLVPDPELFGQVLDLVVMAPSKAAIALLEDYRTRFGAPGALQSDVATKVSTSNTLSGVFAALLSTDLSPADRELHRQWIRDRGPSEAALPGALAETSQQLRGLLELVEGSALDLLIDAGLDLATAIRPSGLIGQDFSEFGLAILELWAFSSGFEDRHRMERVIDLTGDVLARGLSPARFEDVVEYLRACWDPFLTDAACSLGIEVIESLLNYSTSGADAVAQFALPILARIGQHNARRIGRADVDVASLLAVGFGLELGAVVWDSTDQLAGEVAHAKVLVYSLLSRSSARAAEILSTRYPHVEIMTNEDYVATDRLRQQVRRSDVVVITDRAAKHAATDAIKAELGLRQPIYAMGRGSSSIIEAVEAEILRTAASAAV